MNRRDRTPTAPAARPASEPALSDDALDRRRMLEDELEEGLMATFPASDPPSAVMRQDKPI